MFLNLLRLLIMTDDRLEFIKVDYLCDLGKTSQLQFEIHFPKLC